MVQVISHTEIHKLYKSFRYSENKYNFLVHLGLGVLLIDDETDA